MPAPDVLPDKLGPYRLLDRIGEGGMGVVHLARDQENRTVALKVLRSGVAGDPTARRRLAREVETMRRVRSRFVAEVIDADVTGEVPYIVTRYVPGRTLDEVVSSGGPLQGDALRQLACGLAEALVAVHAAGVVHRDLKPGNVMLLRDQPVVIDFGIAQAGDSTKLTQTGMFMGTPGYLAPEVIEGQPVSQASDVHAWGATVAFAATGRSPFGTGSYETIFFRIVQGNANLAGLPVSLRSLVTAALARDPGRRPSAAWLCAQASAGGPGGVVSPGSGAGGLAAAGPVPTVITSAAAPVAGAAVGGGYGAMMDQHVAHPPGPAGAHPHPNGTRPIARPPVAAEDFADLLPPVRYAPPGYAPPGYAPSGYAPPAGGLPRAPGGRPGAGVQAPSGGRDGPRRPEGTAGPDGAGRAARSRDRSRTHPLLGLTAMAIVVAASVVLPVAGTAASLAVIFVLRAADRARSKLAARSSSRGAMAGGLLLIVATAPWAAFRALLTSFLLAPLALTAAAATAAATIITVRSNPLPVAGAYAAGALVAFYGLGPGSGRPRRQLGRLLGSVARTPAATVVTGLVVAALAAAAVAAAASRAPVYWPVPGNLAAHVPTLHNLVTSVEHRLRHLVGYNARIP